MEVFLKTGLSPVGSSLFVIKKTRFLEVFGAFDMASDRTENTSPMGKRKLVDPYIILNMDTSKGLSYQQKDIDICQSWILPWISASSSLIRGTSGTSKGHITQIWSFCAELLLSLYKKKGWWLRMFTAYKVTYRSIQYDANLVSWTTCDLA